jgi:hypothetical protein
VTRHPVRLLAGDLLAIAGGVAAAYCISLVWLYRRAFNEIDPPKPKSPRSVP